jgi:hypothetical protein
LAETAQEASKKQSKKKGGKKGKDLIEEEPKILFPGDPDYLNYIMSNLQAAQD